MLRITRIEEAPGVLHLRLEGRLVGAWVVLFDEELSRKNGHAPAHVVLDLAGVDFASDAGLSSVRQAVKRGARLIACSPLLGALLGKEVQDDR
ncbi:MAG TPA: STAS domain-containing protein [Polyangiaceae bacterium]|nr:STAS domain-containing protein [Polyangiaceae bacterium]